MRFVSFFFFISYLHENNFITKKNSTFQVCQEIADENTTKPEGTETTTDSIVSFCSTSDLNDPAVLLALRDLIDEKLSALKTANESAGSSSAWTNGSTNFDTTTTEVSTMSTDNSFESTINSSAIVSTTHETTQTTSSQSTHESTSETSSEAATVTVVISTTQESTVTVRIADFWTFFDFFNVKFCFFSPFHQ